MPDESDSSGTISSPQLEKTLAWRSSLVIGINFVFGVLYFILTLWQITFFSLYAILPLLYILAFWASHRAKSKEYQNMIDRGKTPDIDIGAHLVALGGNIVALVYLGAAMLTTSTDDFIFIFLVSPMFIATLINFESLGKSVAYFRVTRNCHIYQSV